MGMPWIGPHDLALASVSVVDWKDYPDKPSNSPRTDTERKSRAMLKIEFTTNTNLLMFSNENKYWLGISSWFCDHPHDSDWLFPAIPTFYWRGLEASPDIVEQNVPGSTATKGPFTYYILADVTSFGNAPSGVSPRRLYDLRQTAEDICFNVDVGQIIWIPYRSNTIVVPKEAIAAALRAAPWVYDWVPPYETKAKVAQ
jgi:hypothetical protein